MPSGINAERKKLNIGSDNQPIFHYPASDAKNSGNSSATDTETEGMREGGMREGGRGRGTREEEMAKGGRKK